MVSIPEISGVLKGMSGSIHLPYSSRLSHSALVGHSLLASAQPSVHYLMS